MSTLLFYPVYAVCKFCLCTMVPSCLTSDLRMTNGLCKEVEVSYIGLGRL